MIKVRVFKKDVSGVDGTTLDELLEQAGCVEVGEDGVPLKEQIIEETEGDIEQGEDQPEDGSEEVSDETDDVTLIVVLTPECVDDPALEDEVGRVVGGGGRVVGIWPKDAQEGGVPAILEKVGSGTVVWDPKKLADVLSDEEPAWDTPAGEPRNDPPTKRNKC